MRFLKITLVAMAMAIASGGALAENIAYSDTELLAALEGSYWIALSEPRPKKVYVLAAPWCPFCRQLHKILSGQPSDIEYRFILTAPKSQADRIKIGHAAFSRAAAALDEIYRRGADAGRSATPAEAYADGLNDALWTAITPSLQARSTLPVGLPALVFVSSGRLRVQSGVPADFATLSASVDAASTQTTQPRLPAWLAAPPQLRTIETKIAYARHGDTGLYVAPDVSAAKLALLKTGQGFMAQAVTQQNGERWYAFQFVANGPPAAFGREKDFR